MASYRLSPHAEDDLERIWFYGLETWGLKAADAYIEAMHQRFQELAEAPFLYPAVDEIRSGYRRSVLKSDSIFYRVYDGGVEIMAVLGQQDIEGQL